MIKLIALVLFLLPFPALLIAGQRERTDVTLANRETYAPGTRSFGPVSVPTGTTRVTATFDTSTHTSKSITWALNTEISRDGGKTWAPFVGVARRLGGTSYSGKPAGFSQMLLNSAGEVSPADANTRIKGAYTIGGGSLTTEIKVTLE